MIDLQGLRCPKLVMRVSKLLKDLPVGETLQISTDDPFAYVDIGSNWDIQSLEKKDGYQIINIIKR